MQNDIRKLKESLDKEIKLKGLDHKDVLKISHELDKLILEFHRLEKAKDDKENNNGS